MVSAHLPCILHPLHAFTRCPYHPLTGVLVLAPAHSLHDSTSLHCEICGRRFDITDGIYRLMPDEFRTGTPAPHGDDADVIQKKREMRQRDERAAVSTGFVRVPESHPLYWMNIQYDAVTRHALIPNDGICIDFGTGVGRYIPWLLERAEKIIATDFSLASLRTLQAHLTPEQRARCLLIQCDLSRLPIADETAVAALCVEVLQHLPSHYLRAAAIAEITRTMKPGGRLSLATKAHPSCAQVESVLRRAKWSLRKLLGKPDPRPETGQETHDGPIYTYWHTHDELKRLVAPHLQLQAVRGIMAYQAFPIRWLPHGLRLAANDWLETNSLGKHFARDYLLHLARPSRSIPQTPIPTRHQPGRTGELVTA